jgi:high-affinity K+ transport system ATPase subunit B
MVSKMMLLSIVRFLVFFAAVTGAEARSRSNPQARSLRHFAKPVAKDMPSDRK